ncbi:MAG: UDP-N-acetylmuramoyl-L-alanine--D-glutamate ligase [Fibrobacterota bacterium]
MSKRIGIIGTGMSACAAARLALSRKAQVFMSDSSCAQNVKERLDKAGLPGNVQWEAGGHSAKLHTADMVIVSPGVPRNAPVCTALHSAGVPLVSELQFGFTYLNAPCVAVTGSAGKTTTVTLLGDMLNRAGTEAVVCGNIGTPLSDTVVNGGGAVRVCEVSSFQMEYSPQFTPDTAVVLNIFPNHLDRHESFEEYAELKTAMARQTAVGGTVILNGTQKLLREAGRSLSQREVVFFGKVVPGFPSFTIEKGMIKYTDSRGNGRIWAPVKGAYMEGEHGRMNALALAAAARAWNIPADVFSRTVEAFRPLKHRMEPLGEKNGVAYINDSKSTTVESLCAALSGFREKRVHLIAGGRDKGGDFTRLQDPVSRVCAGVYLIGEAAPSMAQILSSATETVSCSSLESAVLAAEENARPGETILLSPACSSFDMFSGYTERGERFRSLFQGDQA